MSLFKKVTSFAKGSVTGGLAGALVGGPLGAAAGGLLGGYMSYQSDQQANKQNKLAQASIDRANAYDLRMWNLANTYNDPKMQMQRLADAGLNPNLVYGGGNVTGNTASAPGSNGSAESYVADKVGNAIQAQQMMANLMSTRQGIENQKATLGFTKAQTKALNHNINWAIGHGVPVGQQESIPTFVSNSGGSIFDAIIGGSKTRLGRNVKKLYDTSSKWSFWSDLGDFAWKAKNYLTGHSERNSILNRR